jgi:uncharacterized protein YsxB (DUF464 family)
VITVVVRVDTGRRLLGFEMNGHASQSAGARGHNIVCAAVSALVRSCSEALAGQNGVVAVGSGDEGRLVVRVSQCDPGQMEWLRGVTSVLISGLERIRQESPSEVVVTVETEGEQHGS